LVGRIPADEQPAHSGKPQLRSGTCDSDIGATTPLDMKRLAGRGALHVPAEAVAELVRTNDDRPPTVAL
jgi:hypothetical protein